LSPAKVLCLGAGAILLVEGTAILVFTAAGFSLPGSGWHQLIHIVSGLVLIAAGLAGGSAAVAAALVFGAGYLVLSLSGLIDGDTVLGLFETYPADQALHALLGVAAIGAALLSRPSALPEARS
ncbi:MAG: DUF4383 domain-containing protein, partial [Thermoleophilaceae bacterium]|nr:DUF4383 domain-containing protein [Thermoleophilaceae bacterium]